VCFSSIKWPSGIADIRSTQTALILPARVLICSLVSPMFKALFDTFEVVIEHATGEDL
jgi:hypothetical protein